MPEDRSANLQDLLHGSPTRNEVQLPVTLRVLTYDFFLQADYYFSGVWDEAGPDEHRLLAVLAAREDDTPVSRAELIQAANLPSDEAGPAIKAALRHDLIVEVERDGGFRLSVPLMRRWIREATTS
jgi:hypothetical protein